MLGFGKKPKQNPSFPPIEGVGEFIVMKRESGSQFLVVIFPNQDSYELEAEQVRTYLKMIGVPPEVGFYDYVWNFYAAKWNFKTEMIETMSLEQAESFIGARQEVAF